MWTKKDGNTATEAKGQKRDRWPQTQIAGLDGARDTKLSAPTVVILVN